MRISYSTSKQNHNDNKLAQGFLIHIFKTYNYETYNAFITFFYVSRSNAACISSQKASIFSSQFCHLMLTMGHHTNTILSMGMSSFMITMIDLLFLLWKA